MRSRKGYSRITASAACCSESVMAAMLASCWVSSAFSSASISGRAIVDSIMGRMGAYAAFTACTLAPCAVRLIACHARKLAHGQHDGQDEASATYPVSILAIDAISSSAHSTQCMSAKAHSSLMG